MTILNDEPWAKSAVCSQTDPEMWFPEKGNGNTAIKAKEICQGCPVREQCLEYALANNEQFGVWGGMSFNERQKHKHRQPRQPRTHCDKGHELARVGRCGDGRCAQCSREWNRARRREGVA
jgi:WhiB family transcriptional regulator, redox-sensing transcriptional regulator